MTTDIDRIRIADAIDRHNERERRAYEAEAMRYWQANMTGLDFDAKTLFLFDLFTESERLRNDLRKARECLVYNQQKG